MRLNNESSFVVNKLLKTSTWQEEGYYLPPEAKTPPFANKVYKLKWRNA